MVSAPKALQQRADLESGGPAGWVRDVRSSKVSPAPMHEPLAQCRMLINAPVMLRHDSQRGVTTVANLEGIASKLAMIALQELSITQSMCGTEDGSPIQVGALQSIPHVFAICI